MLSKSKFEKQDSLNVLTNCSVILKRANSKHINLILNKEMINSRNLEENVMNVCEFSVEESGYYHISSQITIKNNSNMSMLVEYLQFGICKKNMEDYKSNLKSMIMNSKCNPEYVIVDNLNTIIQLEKDIDYILWVNFGGDKANNFLFDAEYSNLRLYKL